jgi:hypothetical protein
LTSAASASPKGMEALMSMIEQQGNQVRFLGLVPLQRL